MTEPADEVRLEEYLALDAASDLKHEYLNGVVIAMAGASPRHNVVVPNLVHLLKSALADGPCLLFDAGQRVQIEATSSYVYPDLVVTCDAPDFTDERPRSLTNPLLVVEVLSKRTRGYDEGAKLSHYRRIPSVREILLVDSQSSRAALYRRLEDDEWHLKDLVAGTIALSSVDATLPFDAIYAGVESLPLDD